jgi:predicted enzyme related to lactoylglutathione lyase
MKRFHVHVSVTDLDASIGFYSNLFGQEPSKRRPDYAKWMLDDPAVNFAISSRGRPAGVNHLGFQADSAEELATLKQRAEAAAGDDVLNQGQTSCCYARSEKHWTIDPQGLAWEHFHTMSDAATYGQETATPDVACCIPVRQEEGMAAAVSSSCCIPNEPPNDVAARCCT